MKLELLPNEIFLDLFEYLNSINLLHAFYGLNSRFDFLLYKQVRFYGLPFDYVSKRTFDLICQQHLPFITDRVVTLRLSDYKQTMGQINLFLSYIPSFDQFTHLQFLSLSNLHSYETLLKLLDECHHLNSLTHLKFISCSFSNCDASLQVIVDNIWSLPKLTECILDFNIDAQKIFCMPTIISSSLQHVTIYHNKLPLNQINRLFDHTPRLEHLSTSIQFSIDNYYIVSPLPTLIKLNIYYYYGSLVSKINVFSQSMPNLRHFDINLPSELIDGHQWEQLIRNYFPKLRTFRLSMEKEITSNQNTKEQAERLIDSFRSSFWIDEHQWFVRCYTEKRTIHLNTLSGANQFWEVMSPDFWQSTYPHDSEQNFYNNMTAVFEETVFDKPILSHIRLLNINFLYMKFPINDQFWYIASSLNQLNSLTVLFYADTFQTQLQTLLDRAPHLNSLCISQGASLPLQMSVFKCACISVRELDFDDCKHYFSEEECLTLSCSSLGVQCEVLSIRVNNRKNIINLIKNMSNLRAVIVKCEDEKSYNRSTLKENSDIDFCNEEKLINDETVQWFKNRLPSTYVITRNPGADRSIFIWM